jgi:hypothetical protein
MISHAQIEMETNLNDAQPYYATFQNDTMVAHNYHDRSLENPSEERTEVESMVASLTSNEVGFKFHKCMMPFPVKLFAMLERIHEDGLAHIISWQPHGRCFRFHSPKHFYIISNRYFPTIRKFSSFLRQLNLYGFQRLVQHSSDRNAYYHEYFLRGRSYLLHHIHRTQCKGTGVRMKCNPLNEPQFWSMPWMEALQCTNSTSTTAGENTCTVNSKSQINLGNAQHNHVGVVSTRDTSKANPMHLSCKNPLSPPSFRTSSSPLIDSVAQNYITRNNETLEDDGFHFLGWSSNIVPLTRDNNIEKTEQNATINIKNESNNEADDDDDTFDRAVDALFYNDGDEPQENDQYSSMCDFTLLTKQKESRSGFWHE